MVWGGGILQRWGVEDFAGGIVVHNIAGLAALASVLYVGKRRVLDRGPHSIPLVALGTGLLWFGWYGFNAGSEMRVDSVTGTAFLNTDIAASFAAVAWLIVAWIRERKPKFLGLLTGAVAGLATITPAAGYVSPTTAVIIGVVSGVVCYFAVEMKNKLHWDDALDVWGVHGVGGFLGIVMLGLFANSAFNPAGTNGLLYGNPGFFVKQLVAVLFSSVWAFGFTYAMLRIINMFTPVKVSEMSEEIGLDESIHGEHAYETLEVEELFNGDRRHLASEHSGRGREEANWSAPGNSYGGSAGTFRRFLGRSVLAGTMLCVVPASFCARMIPPYPRPQLAPAPTRSKPWWHTITANGFASLSYGYNTNQPYDRLNQFRVFDFNDNEPQLDMAQLVIQRAIEKPNQFGFRFNMIAGSGRSRGHSRLRNVSQHARPMSLSHFDIPELYVSYIAPLGKGLRIRCRQDGQPPGLGDHRRLRWLQRRIQPRIHLRLRRAVYLHRSEGDLRLHQQDHRHGRGGEGLG